MASTRANPAAGPGSTIPTQAIDNPNEIDTGSAKEVLLAEYKTLRDEAIARIGKQQEITSYSLALFASVAVLTQYLLQQGRTPSTYVVVYAFASVLLSTFSLMALDHEMNLAHIYIYVDRHIRPYLADADSTQKGATGPEKPRTLGWNAFRSQMQQRNGKGLIFSGPLSASKYGIPLALNGVVLVYLVTSVHLPVGWAIAAYGIPAVVLLFVISCGAYTVALYYRMGRPDGGLSAHVMTTAIVPEGVANLRT